MTLSATCHKAPYSKPRRSSEEPDMKYGFRYACFMRTNADGTTNFVGIERLLSNGTKPSRLDLFAIRFWTVGPDGVFRYSRISKTDSTEAARVYSFTKKNEFKLIAQKRGAFYAFIDAGAAAYDFQAANNISPMPVRFYAV